MCGLAGSSAIDILLILVIFRAVRPHPLTPRAALLPLALLAIAGIIYLRPVTLSGNDLALIGILAAVGVVLGTLSGMADRIWPEQGGCGSGRAPCRPRRDRIVPGLGSRSHPRPPAATPASTPRSAGLGMNRKGPRAGQGR